MKDFEDYKKSMDKKLNLVDAKLSYMNEGLQGLSKAFKEFREEMDDFIDFAGEKYSDHENRIAALEEKLN